MAVSSILDVDLLAFESSTGAARRAVVDGVRRSLETGFVYTSHDLPEDLLDTAYGMLAEFFSLEPEVKQRFTVPGVNGQTGYTGLLVETAASSDRPDWKEMLNWSVTPPAGHPLRRRFPGSYPDQVLPEEVVPGITEVLGRFHRAIDDLQRRFLRVIAERVIRIHSLDEASRVELGELDELLDYRCPGNEFALSMVALALAGFSPDLAPWPGNWNGEE